MPHPTVQKGVPFAFELLFAADEEGRPLAVPLIRATYDIKPESGALVVAEKQVEPKPAGEPWFEGAETSSYKYEPEVAFFKAATDVVLIGHARAPNGNAPYVDVGVKVGPAQKIVRVFGDRYWIKTGGQVYASKPQPFEKIPLVYERAFGGWDKANKDEKAWRVEQRNPVGRGYGDPLRYVDEGKVPMPNIEDPNHLIKRYGEAPPPAGVGFTSPNWQPRARYAGTYDTAWDKERKPLLPKDFDRRFFNAASPGLIAPGYLRGDEDVVIVGAAAVSPLRFKLPGVPELACRLELRSGRVETMRCNLDTVLINTDEMRLFLLWRAHVRVPTGPHDVLGVEVTSGHAHARAIA
jgi:hypothetical protein